MKILPAIDIYDGKVVRLTNGDYDKMTIYSDDPIEVANTFKSSGIKYIHIVDLEGAKLGNPSNFEIIKKIKNKTNLFCEVGGGIRTLEDISNYIGSGINRVILGTIAITDIELLKKAIKLYNDKIAISLDIKDNKVAIKGWLEQSEVDIHDLSKQLEDLGIKNIICTDISKDGTLLTPNIQFYNLLNTHYSFNITASGGVSSIDDINQLKNINLDGVIIGKAYYEGLIELNKLLEV